MLISSKPPICLSQMMHYSGVDSRLCQRKKQTCYIFLNMLEGEQVTVLCGLGPKFGGQSSWELGESGALGMC